MVKTTNSFFPKKGLIRSTTVNTREIKKTAKTKVFM